MEPRAFLPSSPWRCQLTREKRELPISSNCPAKQSLLPLAFHAAVSITRGCLLHSKKVQGTQERPCKSSVSYSMYRDSERHTIMVHASYIQIPTAQALLPHTRKNLCNLITTHTRTTYAKKIQLYISRDYIYLINNYIQTRRVTTNK